MGKAAMCGMIGALSITVGTIVIPSENFIRLKANEAGKSAVWAATMEYKVPNTDNTCQHTDGNHTSDCPYWTGELNDFGNSSNGTGYGNHHTEDENYDSGHHGSSHHGSGHHGGGHHGK